METLPTIYPQTPREFGALISKNTTGADTTVHDPSCVPPDSAEAMTEEETEEEKSIGTHRETPLQERGSPICPLGASPRTPEKGADTVGDASNRDGPIPSVQALLYIPHRHSIAPARWTSLLPSPHALNISSMVLLSLCLFSPDGVHAVPIADYFNSTRGGAAPLPSTTSDLFILLPSVASLFYMLKRFIEGGNRNTLSKLPILTVLISIIPLSIFTFWDISLDWR
jgi:hypothetical protein